MRILVAIEDPANSAQPGNALARWMDDTNVEIHLLSVLRPSDVAVEEAMGNFEPIVPVASSTGAVLPGVHQHYREGAGDRGQSLERARMELIDQLKAAGSRWFPNVAVVVHAVEDDDTGAAILRVAGETSANLIALAAHHHSRLGQRLRTNLHEEIIQKAGVPVFVVGPEVVGM